MKAAILKRKKTLIALAAVLAAIVAWASGEKTTNYLVSTVAQLVQSALDESPATQPANP